MSGGLELKVTLVGGDDTEQDILAGRQTPPDATQAPAAQPQPPARPPDPQSAVVPSMPTPPDPQAPAQPAAPQPAPVPATGKQNAAPVPTPTATQPPQSQSPAGTGFDQAAKTVVDSVDRLSEMIDRLIQVELGKASAGQQSQQANQSQPQPQDRSMLQRIADTIGDLWSKGPGRTRTGKAISSAVTVGRRAGAKALRAIERTSLGRRAIGGLRTAAKGLASRAAKTRLGQAVTARMAGSAAATAGASATAGAAGSAAGAGAAAVAAAAGPLIVVGAAAAGAAMSVKGLSDAITDATEELREYSPALAMARSQIEVNRDLQRLDRAGRTGAGLAQIESARGRIQESMYEVQTKILEVVLKFAPLIEGLLDTANAGIRIGDAGIANLANIYAQLNNFNPINPNFNDDAAAQARADAANAAMLQAIRDIFADNAPPNNGMDPWIAQLFQIPGPGRRGPGPMPPGPRFP